MKKGTVSFFEETPLGQIEEKAEKGDSLFFLDFEVVTWSDFSVTSGIPRIAGFLKFSSPFLVLSRCFHQGREPTPHRARVG
ncbi:MAG: hypothetical protein OXT71_23075 [Acidobacteriota bacterium]|nr:hypothetical protein [Acidobacteriota bacterium]